MKIKHLEALRKEYPAQEANSFFHLLTEEYLGMTRLQVALSPERPVNEKELERFENALNRLLQHEPIQYILGKTEFYGLPFKVNEAVLIPRPETEELVEWIIGDVENRDRQDIKILDIGTGSGCIAIALAAKLPNAEVSAVDVSEEALEIAKGNAALNNIEIEFQQLNILEAEELPSTYDIIVSNPPYVREVEKKNMERNVLQNEPGLALWVKDEDPLLFYEKITRLAGNSLNSQGALYFEINEAFGKETAGLLSENNFDARLKKDIFGKDRMLKGIQY